MRNNKIEKVDYYLYYTKIVNSDHIYITYSSVTKAVATYNYSEFHDRTHNKLSINYISHNYHLLTGYDETEEGLLKYAYDFEIWTNELKEFKPTLKNGKYVNVNALYYYTLHTMTEQVFRRIATDKFEHHEPETPIEMNYSECCNRGGIVDLDENFKDKYIESHAYDLRMAYPETMTSQSLSIPNKPGCEYKLTEIPKILKVGYYKVRITSENKNFKKIFAFSKKNTYDHKALYQAIKFKDMFDVKIELNQKLQYNAYLYDDDDIETGNKIFGEWYKIVSELKDAFPHNGIVKFISSSLHGHIEKKYTIRKTEQEVEDENLDIGMTSDYRYYIKDIEELGIGTPNHRTIYYLIDNENKKSINIRLSSFLTSAVRNKAARLCTGIEANGKVNKNQEVKRDLNGIIRVFTDCVVFNSKQEDLENMKNIKKEVKTTGLIKWFNACTYYNTTTGYFGGYWKEEKKQKEIMLFELYKMEKINNAFLEINKNQNEIYDLIINHIK